MAATSDNPDEFPWSLGVFDAHCHPTDTMASVPDISKMNARALTVMATRAQDQDLVDSVSKDHALRSSDSSKINDQNWRGIIPSFGWHPWFSHQIYDDDDHSRDVGDDGRLDEEAKISHYQHVLEPASSDRTFLSRLPDPQSISSFITSTSKRLSQHPLALIGEVGLDKAFRIPEDWLPEQAEKRSKDLTPGGREGRRLSPYRVSMNHQKKILLAQLRLAGRMQRAVSVHGVQAHGHLYETLHETWQGHERSTSSKKALKKQRKQKDELDALKDDRAEDSKKADNVPQFPPRVCLHSYSGPPDTLKQYLHPSVPVQFFFSFSTVINFSTPASSKTEQVIKALPDDRILIESDLHIAGDRMDQNLKEITQKLCTTKGWTITDGVRQLGKNWKSFVFGEGTDLADSDNDDGDHEDPTHSRTNAST